MRSDVLIQDLEYADDMVIVSDSMDILEEVLWSVNDICSGAGLSISSKKTKILPFSHLPHSAPHLDLSN